MATVNVGGKQIPLVNPTLNKTADKVPKSATIVGTNTIDSNQTSVYTVQVTYMDGSVVQETIDLTSDNPLITTTGLSVASGEATNDTVVNLSAEFSKWGSTVQANKAVTVIKFTAPYSATITPATPGGDIRGYSTNYYGSSDYAHETYTMNVQYTGAYIYRNVGGNTYQLNLRIDGYSHPADLIQKIKVGNTEHITSDIDSISEMIGLTHISFNSRTLGDDMDNAFNNIGVPFTIEITFK